MITRQHGFPPTYPADEWIGRSGKAGWLPAEGPNYRTGQVPAGGAQWFEPVKPKLMMDPSDPTTWQRAYRFTL
jgi:hypothetical protein